MSQQHMTDKGAQGLIEFKFTLNLNAMSRLAQDRLAWRPLIVYTPSQDLIPTSICHVILIDLPADHLEELHKHQVVYQSLICSPEHALQIAVIRPLLPCTTVQC